MQELQLRCESTTHGNICTWIGELCNLDKHMSVCEKALLPCRLCCGMRIKIKELQAHEEGPCTNKRVPCTYCKKMFKLSILDFHEDNYCRDNPNSVIECGFKEQGCQYKGKSGNVKLHEKFQKKCIWICVLQISNHCKNQI